MCGAETWTRRRGDLRGALVRAARPRSRATSRRSSTIFRRRAMRTAASPIVTVNLWFDRPVLDEPFVGLPGRAMQWVFDKRLMSRRRDVAPVARVERRRRRRAPDERRADRRWRCDELRDALPSVRDARHGHARTVVREPRATFSLAPGQPARPATHDGRQGTVPRRRLDRHRAARDDRKRRAERPSRRATRSCRHELHRRPLQGAGAQGTEPPVVRPDARSATCGRR